MRNDTLSGRSQRAQRDNAAQCSTEPFALDTVRVTLNCAEQELCLTELR